MSRHPTHGPTHRRPARLLAPVLAALATACGGDAGTGPGDAADRSPQPPAAVRVTPGEIGLDWIGQTAELDAEVLGPTGAVLDRPVTWTSSDSLVATVDGTGRVTARGVGEARLEAAADGAAGLARVTVRQLPTSLRIVSGDGQSAPGGALLDAPLVVEVRDEGGTPAPDVALSWFVSLEGGSLEAASERTGPEGRGSARWRMGVVPGTHTVRVVMQGPVTPGLPPLTASAGFTALAEEGDGTAGGDPVVLASVTPEVLVEGASATLRGSGFGPSPGQNSVVLDGLAAPVLTASETTLTIRVPEAPCRPPRTARLSVSRGAAADTAEVQVTPPDLLVMEPGEGWVAGSGCLHLDGGDGDRTYLVGFQSTAPSAGLLTPVTLGSAAATDQAGATPAPLARTPTAGGEAPASRGSEAPGRGLPGDPYGRPRPLLLSSPSTRPSPAAARVPLRAAGNLPEPSPRRARHREAEADLRRREEAEIQAMGGLDAVRAAARGWWAEGAARPPGPAGAPGPSAVPAVGDTLVLAVGSGCSGRPQVTAVTRYVGTGTVWLEDTSNPAGGLDTRAYEALDARYQASVAPTLADYFGTDRDVDGNGRLLVLVTKQVNEDDGLLGYVWAGDLFPARFCPGSNEAEIFYGLAPDPAGLHGPERSAEDVLAEYPALMAHEATHVVQRSEQLFGDAGGKTRWETEGGATLAEQLVGHAVTGFDSGQDLGWNVVDAWRDWYVGWVADLALYYGYRSGRHVAGAPEECTWIGGEEQGNDGPCVTARAVYGVPALVLRWVLDRYGPEVPGGERALMRTMTASTASGYATLEEATGEDIQVLLAGFYAALWQDGRYFDALPSWDLFDIFANIQAAATLVPYESGAVEPELSLRVRGGSTGLLVWSPGAHRPTSLRVMAPGEEPFPPYMAAWVVRLR